MREGDYCKVRYATGLVMWDVVPPGGVLGCVGENHEVAEHGDGTITVTPSLRELDGAGVEVWHGWLTRGVWRW